MAESWPTDIVAYRCDFYLRANTSVFQSPVTRSTQRLKRQGQLWMATLSFRLARAKDQRLAAMLALLDGAYGTVRVWDHAQRLPLGENLDRSSLPITYFSSGGSPSVLTGFSSAGSPSVITYFYGGAAQVIVQGWHALGSTDVLTDGWYPSITVLKAGDKVEIDERLYLLTADAVSSSIGRATLSVRPPLRADVDHAEVVTRTRPRAEMRLVDDDQPARPADVDGQYERTITLVEVL